MFSVLPPSLKEAVFVMDVQEPKCLLVEIVEEILCRLPVKPLMRFKCVSKTWCALIEDSVFVEKHLVHSRKNHPGIVLAPEYWNNEFVYILNQSSHPNVTIQPKHLMTIRSCGNHVYISNHLPHQVAQTNERTVALYGSCDGLLCLVDPRTNNQWPMWLFNPSTRKYKRLPNAPVTTGPKYGWSFGFGYNATLKDYQVIRIIRSRKANSGNYYPLGEVYSLRHNSWKQIQIPHTVSTDTDCRGVFINGSVHWAILDERNEFNILAFNFETEEFFYLLPLLLPDFPSYEDILHYQLVVLDSCLCFIMFYEFEDSFYEGWMMKDYGVKKSWTKIFKLKGGGSCSQNIDDHFWSDAHNIFMDCVYKSEDKNAKQLSLFRPGFITYAGSYVESLVPLS